MGRIHGDAALYNEAAEPIMLSQGIIINNLFDFAFPRLADLQVPDDVHFKDPEGSQALAEQVAAYIKRTLDAEALMDG